jgi:hypothetical protein
LDVIANLDESLVTLQSIPRYLAANELVKGDLRRGSHPPGGPALARPGMGGFRCEFGRGAQGEGTAQAHRGPASGLGRQYLARRTRRVSRLQRRCFHTVGRVTKKARSANTDRAFKFRFAMSRLDGSRWHWRLGFDKNVSIVVQIDDRGITRVE